MMESEKISVIVPVYNVEKYLDDCIDSIVSQKYDNLEIILVDDGSTDSSAQICDKWAEKDPRIRVIHKPNGGLSDARNAGLKIAAGKYLAFVDSDDFIDPDMYFDMYRNLRENDCELCSCGRYEYCSPENKKKVYCLSKTQVLNKNDYVKNLLSHRLVDEAVWDKLYKRELFDGLVFPKGEINEDVVIAFEIAEKCSSAAYINKPYYYYRMTPNSITHSGYSEKKRVVIKHMEAVKKIIAQHYQGFGKYLASFEFRYSISAMKTMLGTEGTKEKYSSDYMYYRKTAYKTALAVLLNELSSIKEKTKAILLYFGVLEKVWALKGKHKN